MPGPRYDATGRLQVIAIPTLNVALAGPPFICVKEVVGQFVEQRAIAVSQPIEGESDLSKFLDLFLPTPICGKHTNRHLFTLAVDVERQAVTIQAARLLHLTREGLIRLEDHAVGLETQNIGAPIHRYGSGFTWVETEM